MTINYEFSRHTPRLFCEDQIKNPAARAMLLINFEYRAGGEPVFRSTNTRIRKGKNKFVSARKHAQTAARLRAARKAGGLHTLKNTFKAKMIRLEHKKRIGK
jgi:hypothetical protein